jgi:hypothetical protein
LIPWSGRLFSKISLPIQSLFMFVKEIHSNENSPLTGNLVFKQNQLSPLNAGTGTVTVKQTVRSEHGEIPETTYQNVHKFAVNGPRFSLPFGAITSVFPPDNAQGDYDKVMPHVCFNRATLPWDRNILAQSKRLLGEVKDQAPWMTVLSVFDTDPAVKVSQIDVSGLVNPSEKIEGAIGTLPEKYFHPSFILDKTIEKYTDKCLVVDIPVGLFNTIAPCVDDLPWMAHVRQIQPSIKQSALYLNKLKGISSTIDLPEIATVIGNRLPLPGGKTTAYLVSLEGWGGHLPSDDEIPVSGIPVGMTHVRLVLLKEWNIYAIDRKQHFFGYLQNLNLSEGDFTGTMLQLAADYETGEAGDAINNAFNMGFAPLNHHTRQGDQTVSWYRGPFVPYDVKAGEIQLPINGPDSCMGYNPDTGMLDVSYAAAWQLGQLLALQNGNFAETLYNWKWGNTRDIISKFEQEIISKTLKEIVDEESTPLRVVPNAPVLGFEAHAQANLLKLMNASIGKILTAFMDNKDNYSDENR